MNEQTEVAKTLEYLSLMLTAALDMQRELGELSPIEKAKLNCHFSPWGDTVRALINDWRKTRIALHTVTETNEALQDKLAGKDEDDN